MSFGYMMRLKRELYTYPYRVSYLGTLDININVDWPIFYLGDAEISDRRIK